MKSTFKAIIELVNSKELDDIVTRKELTTICNTATIDNYRLMLCHCGYLRYTGRGKYTVIKHVPESVTYNKLRKSAY